MAREDEIKAIAYSLWEQEGCPQGKDREHWSKAEAIWEQQQVEKTASIVGAPSGLLTPKTPKTTPRKKKS